MIDLNHVHFLGFLLNSSSWNQLSFLLPRDQRLTVMLLLTLHGLEGQVPLGDKSHDLEVLGQLEEGVQPLLLHLGLALVDKVQQLTQIFSLYAWEYIIYQYYY